jgi:O-antigen/teichoic acid export membrane protein
VAVYKVYLLVAKKSIYWFSITYAVDHFMIAIILLVYYHKLGGQKMSVSFSRFRKMLSTSKHFILSSLMVSIFAQTDKIMLKLMVSDEAVGIYSVAVTCAGMTSFVFAAIIDSVRPAVFENKKRDPASYENSLVMSYAVVIWLSLAQSAFMSLLAKPIIRIMYGPEYAGAAKVLCLVVWYTTFSYIGPIRNIWLMAEDKQKYLWVINTSGALANVVLNALMIPMIGIMGAALASLITQIFTNVVVGFIMTPIRYNNMLMIRALNPQVLLKEIRTLKR